MSYARTLGRFRDAAVRAPRSHPANFIKMTRLNLRLTLSLTFALSATFLAASAADGAAIGALDTYSVPTRNYAYAAPDSTRRIDIAAYRVKFDPKNDIPMLPREQRAFVTVGLSLKFPDGSPLPDGAEVGTFAVGANSVLGNATGGCGVAVLPLWPGLHRLAVRDP